MPLDMSKWTKNYLYEHMMYLIRENAKRLDPETGLPGIVKIFNSGGTRSSKSYDGIAVILTFLQWFGSKGNEKSLYVAVYRDTMVSARKKTLKDFLEYFNILGLISGKDYEVIGENGTTAPSIKIWGHKIDFLGVPERSAAGKPESVRADIVYVNELLENNDKEAILDIMQRCQMLFIADWNPSATVHWGYEYDGFNVFKTTTTYLDNLHLDPKLRGEYEAWCPWDFSDSVIELYDPLRLGKGFMRRRWLKPDRPNHITEEMDIEHKYRRDNKLNKERKSINKNRWLVYCEGIPTLRDGAVIENYEYIQEFPATGMTHVGFGLDFGFRDPTVLTRTGKDGKKRYIEYCTYAPMDTSEIIYHSIKPHLLKEEKRQQQECGRPEFRPTITIICDSQDKLRTDEVSENIVIELCKYAKADGNTNWKFWKVQKPTVLARIDIMRSLECFVVESDKSKEEFSNYIFEEGTNNPIDKFNHGMDSWGYCEYGYLQYRS